VVHTCNPSTWRLKQEDRKLEWSLGYRVPANPEYTVNPCPIKSKIKSPSSPKAEAGGSLV
jgi:hypothetical protein